jgi:hypothetical protein
MDFVAFDVETEIEIYESGLGIKAESPLPPGFFGYDPDRGPHSLIRSWPWGTNEEARHPLRPLTLQGVSGIVFR